jgi:multidrug efflux pump subunit AcrB
VVSDRTKNPDVRNEILYVADGGPRFYLTLTPIPPDPGSAFFIVDARDYEGAIRTADRAWRYLSENHPEAQFKIKRLAMGSVESGIVDVEISGPNADRLLALGAAVRSLFRNAPGIRDNDDDWGNKIIKVIVDIDQDRARQLGLTSEEVTQLLKTYFTGTAVSDYRKGDNSIPIVLRASEETHTNLEGLTSATFAHNGKLVSLYQIARLRTGFDFARIRRKNQQRTVIVTGRSATLTANQLLDNIQPGLQKLDLSGGYRSGLGEN